MPSLAHCETDPGLPRDQDIRLALFHLKAKCPGWRWSGSLHMTLISNVRAERLPTCSSGPPFEVSDEQADDAFGLTSCCLRSDALSCQDDVPRQQRFDLGLGCRLRQLGKDVAQIGVGFQAVGLGCFDQAVKAC